MGVVSLCVERLMLKLQRKSYIKVIEAKISEHGRND